MISEINEEITENSETELPKFLTEAEKFDKIMTEQIIPMVDKMSMKQLKRIAKAAPARLLYEKYVQLDPATHHTELKFIEQVLELAHIDFTMYTEHLKMEAEAQKIKDQKS